MLCDDDAILELAKGLGVKTVPAIVAVEATSVRILQNTSRTMELLMEFAKELKCKQTMVD